MSRAALYLHANAFDTGGKALLGRHSAGESFLRGYFRHATTPRYDLWNAMGRPQAELEALLARIEPPQRPIRWIGQAARPQLNDPGVVQLPDPNIGVEAWRRQPYGSRSYAITGLTHTTATATVMRILPDLLISPLEDFDALICTSSAVRAAVETQLDMMRAYLQESFGPRARPEPQRVTIPLGVNAVDFKAQPAQRAEWRARLQIPDDAVVALYVGRLSVKNKMNPALMAMALERAARRTGRRLWWICSGWVEPTSGEAAFHDQVRALCPSVEYRHVDGRQPDVRFSIWSAADLFISFPDNIQETFGLTPIEAMAAGLPCVVSDWDGYKDTVRSGEDGFRIPTVAPRPGFGGDLAYWFANEWITYDTYVGATAQYTAVDLDAAERALVTLIEDPGLRATMGAAGQQRAEQVFDWSAVIPQYEALWAEQNARRIAAGPERLARRDPYRPDPYVLFAGYPTRHLRREDVIVLNPGQDWPVAKAHLDSPLAAYSPFNRPSPAELAIVVTHLTEQGPTTVAALRELVPETRRNFLERGLIWLARHDVVAIQPAA